MMNLKQYKIVYIVFYIEAALSSDNILGPLNLKRRLESDNTEVCQAKQFILDTANSDQNLPVKVSVSSKENNDLFYDNIVNEHINVEIMSEGIPKETIADQDINNDNDEEDKDNDQIITELVEEMVRNEKRFILNNFQSCSNIFNYLEDE
ncbi:hypothetical protein PAEPH01_2841, partial [Pancytospora epiphaga]